MFGKRFLVFSAIAISLSVAQVYFQGTDTNQNRQPTKHSRKPIQSDKCSEGEFLYPGDNDKDWVCDCKPVHVYHPETVKCHAIFSQGPCKKGEILVMPPRKSIPKCQRNACSGTKVSFRGRCITLNSNEGCPPHLIAQVNATSLQVTCALDLENRLNFNTDDEEQEQDPVPSYNYNSFPVDNSIGAVCLPGGKRSQEEKCLDS